MRDSQNTEGEEREEEEGGRNHVFKAVSCSLTSSSDTWLLETGADSVYRLITVSYSKVNTKLA